MKTKVNVDEVMRKIKERKVFNKLNLNKIEWVNDKGEIVKVKPETIKEWEYCGLNNTDFVELAIFGDFEESVKRRKAAGKDNEDIVHLTPNKRDTGIHEHD